jgi:nucleoside-diphosphate-sugar epimerase
MILITGGTGAMGRVLVRRFLDKGKQVRVLTLPGDPQAPSVAALGAHVVFGDVADPAGLDGICNGVETVYHCAAVIIAFDDKQYRRVNAEGTRNMVLQAQKSGVRHFVLVSSASVTYAKTTAYSRSKVEAENIVTASGLNWTIVRPTLVYDETGGLEFRAFLEYLNKFPIVPFIGVGKATKRPVHVDDVIQGLEALFDRSLTYGKIYNLSGGEPITMIGFARLCLRLSGEEHKLILCIPVWLCMILSAVLGLVMKKPPLRWPVIAGVIQDANLDPTDAIKDLGYSPARISEKLKDCLKPGRSQIVG